MLEYHAAFFKQADGWYVVEMMDFPGVHSQGKTLRSARVMIRDAMKLMAECLVEGGSHCRPPIRRPNRHWGRSRTLWKRFLWERGSTPRL